MQDSVEECGAVCVCVFIYWQVDFKMYLEIPMPRITKIIFKK